MVGLPRLQAADARADALRCGAVGGSQRHARRATVGGGEAVFELRRGGGAVRVDCATKGGAGGGDRAGGGGDDGWRLGSRDKIHLIHPARIRAAAGRAILHVAPFRGVRSCGDAVGLLLPVHRAGNPATLDDAIEIEFQIVVAGFRRHFPPKGQRSRPGQGDLHPSFLTVGDSSAAGGVNPVMSGRGLGIPGGSPALGDDQPRLVNRIGHTGSGVACAGQRDVERVFIRIVAGNVDGGGAGIGRAGREGDREGGAGSGGQGGRPECPDGEVAGVGAVLGHGQPGERGRALVSHREGDGRRRAADASAAAVDAGVAVGEIGPAWLLDGDFRNRRKGRQRHVRARARAGDVVGGEAVVVSLPRL